MDLRRDYLGKMLYRIFTYILIVVVFTLFIINFLNNLESTTSDMFDVYHYMSFIGIGLLFALFNIIIMTTIRYLIDDLIFFNTASKIALKILIYTINILTLFSCIMILSYIISLTTPINLFDVSYKNFLVPWMLFSLLYGVLIDFLLSGITIFGEKK